VHNGTPYRLPQLQMANSDLSRLINSDEVQSKVNAPKEGTKPAVLKRNPLKSKAAMDAINPAAAAARKRATAAQEAATKAKAKLVADKRAGKAKNAKKGSKAITAGKKSYYESMVATE